MSEIAISTVSVTELHDLLLGTGEFALIDVREAGVTAQQGSILLAVSVPLSSLELRIDALVPRRATPVIVYDGGTENLAGRAARRLRELGYTDVKVLVGGLLAWGKAGYKIQRGGDHVIGQAFGEFIEDIYKTPHITVAEFLAKVAAGDDLVLLDSRPLAEFEGHSLPGGTSIPGAELVYRAGEVVPSPDSLVVVNCAGRTRSILGAQVLINAGLPNQVVALEGGTQSWVLEGHELEHGKKSAAPLPSGKTLESAKGSAARIAERFGVKTIDLAVLQRFHDEAELRSLYVLDVRTPEEFEREHLSGSYSAPSWDVAPWVFRHVGTHNARIVLVDNDLVRATVAASWIVQFGWGEVFVVEGVLSGGALKTGTASHRVLGLEDARYDAISAKQLQKELDSAADIHVIDLQSSVTYRKGHLPGAYFAIRARLSESADGIPGSGLIVLTSSDGVLARLAAEELTAATSRPVQVLDGGTAAWEAQGFSLQIGGDTFLHDAEDAVASGWWETDLERQKEGFRKYLSWELGLVDELRQDDTVPFKIFV